jgi:hypothetical protein
MPRRLDTAADVCRYSSAVNTNASINAFAL